MCHYLRSSEGRNVVVKLLENVSNIHNIDLLKDCATYGVYVCGADSASGDKFLKYLRQIGALVLGSNVNTIGNLWAEINYVDLCILINKPIGNGPRIAVLGEVEGNKGGKITGGFFDKKSHVCSFAIGVKPGFGDIRINNVLAQSGFKTVVQIGTDYDVIKDFHVAIDQVEMLFEKGVDLNVVRHPGYLDVVDMVKFYWRKPVDELISELRQFIKAHDQAEVETNQLTIYPKVTPKLII